MQEYHVIIAMREGENLTTALGKGAMHVDGVAEREREASMRPAAANRNSKCYLINITRLSHRVVV
jgi:hypothetical protein